MLEGNALHALHSTRISYFLIDYGYSFHLMINWSQLAPLKSTVILKLSPVYSLALHFTRMHYSCVELHISCMLLFISQPDSKLSIGSDQLLLLWPNTLESSWIPFILSHSIFKTSTDPVRFIFKTYSASYHSLPPPLLPPWYKPSSSLAWITAMA